jgi:hypothetical protein
VQMNRRLHLRPTSLGPPGIVPVTARMTHCAIAAVLVHQRDSHSPYPAAREISAVEEAKFRQLLVGSDRSRRIRPARGRQATTIFSWVCRHGVCLRRGRAGRAVSQRTSTARLVDCGRERAVLPAGRLRLTKCGGRVPGPVPRRGTGAIPLCRSTETGSVGDDVRSYVEAEDGDRSGFATRAAAATSITARMAFSRVSQPAPVPWRTH